MEKNKREKNTRNINQIVEHTHIIIMHTMFAHALRVPAPRFAQCSSVEID